MALLITRQIVMFDKVLEPGDVLREGDSREAALEASGWGIVVDEEQLHWFQQSEDDDDSIVYLDDEPWHMPSHDD